MTSHVIASYDHEQMIYNQRNYIRTTYFQTNRNELYHSTLPIPSIDVCEKLFEDGGSATSSSYINSNSEHYDNTLAHTYDNPMEYRENYSFEQSLIKIPNENFYDNAKCEEKSSTKSPVFFYLENKRLIFYVCLIFICLLILIVLGIFLLNKFLRPVFIHTTINNHYDMINTTNSTTTTTTTITPGNLPFPYSTCPPDRWGNGCENICKPCGLGVCHSLTGKCICPVDIYGEFCDLWKVNDKPRRGDMMN